jgi:hypothetical protein
LDCDALAMSLGCTPEGDESCGEDGSDCTFEIGNPGNSATNITWEIPGGSGDATLTCTVASRAKPQNQNCEYNPSSCGVFEINRGATAVFLDGSVPVPGKPAAGLGPTDPIELQVCTP